MSILKVKASGNIKKKPDKIILQFHLTEEAKTYSETLKKGTDLASLFIISLSEFNIKKENVKTNGFSIREVFIDVETRKKDSYGRNITKKELDKYKYYQDLTTEIDLDLELLSRLVETISKMKNPPKLNICFGIKNIENAQSEALELAFNNCKEKAEMLAKISGKSIKDCLEINYDVPYNYNSYVNNCICDSESLYKMRTSNIDLNSSIVPNDIEITENIITIWEI